MSPRELLNQAEIVTKIEQALRGWWERLEGKTGYVPAGASNPVFADVPDPSRYIIEPDRQATREVLGLVGQHAPLLRSLLSKYGCHGCIRPKLTSMLDVASARSGEDPGGWWSRARDYAGTHLSGGPRSVPDELARWAEKLRSEAANLGAAAAPGAPASGSKPTWSAKPTDAMALLEIQAKCKEWGEALRRNGWDSDKTAAANAPETKAMEMAVMGLIKKHEALLTYCRNNFVRDPSTPLDRAFDYIGIYLGRGPDALKHTVGLPECLTVEISSATVQAPYREPTFVEQLGRWAQKLSELAEQKGDDFITGLLVGPEDRELSDKELALLEAHLKQPMPVGRIQQGPKATGKSQWVEDNKKLKLIRDYNRNLREAAEGAGKADTPEAVTTAGEDGSDTRAAEETAPFAFYRDGDWWVLRFDGKGTLLEHRKGLTYLRQLLMYPREKQNAEKMAQLEGYELRGIAARRYDGKGLYNTVTRAMYRARDAIHAKPELFSLWQHLHKHAFISKLTYSPDDEIDWKLFPDK